MKIFNEKYIIKFFNIRQECKSTESEDSLHVTLILHKAIGISYMILKICGIIC
jgi:hypothetical protein